VSRCEGLIAVARAVKGRHEHSRSNQRDFSGLWRPNIGQGRRGGLNGHIGLISLFDNEPIRSKPRVRLLLWMNSLPWKNAHCNDSRRFTGGRRLDIIRIVCTSCADSYQSHPRSNNERLLSSVRRARTVELRDRCGDMLEEG
jgi:hypothetical protein